MDASFIDGRNSGENTTCSRCGRPISSQARVCLQTQTDGECICADCYNELLVPGAGDAHGNMS
jgi:hypothetical protein